MKEYKQLGFSAASVTVPGMVTCIDRFHEEFPAFPDPFARTAAFAMDQPDNVDLNEMLSRLGRREL